MRNIDPRGNKQQLMMPCPCTTCLNHIEHKVEEVHFHLFKYEIDLSYTKWDKHGEKDEQATTAQIPVNTTTEFVDDMDFDMNFGSKIPTDGPAIVEMVNATKESFDEDDLAKFQERLLDAEKPLYKGCTNFTKLSAIVKLLNLKGTYGASDKFFNELLGLLKKNLPASNEMVEKTYQAKKLMRMMGSGYKKIHVDNKTHKVYENIPAKVMWYYPIIPRLKRLFKLESISEDLRWHATRRITDGVLRHPADSHAWRTIDEKFLKIAKDLRNLRLGISADGVDVNSGTRHHRYLGNDIDVFLEPVVDDLHTLFEIGVDTYDASTKENFNLRVVVLWMINDYPAIGTLCGCSYSGFKGCVVCGKDTYSVRLSASSKQSYARHRRYLPYNHPFRRKKKRWEDSKAEKETTKEYGSSNQVNEAYWKKFNIWYRKLRVPQGYCSNFSRLVSLKDRKLIGLKSHDYHMLMQELLPIDIRLIMHPPTRYAIIRPEGCITEETITKETIEFFSEYHKTTKTIGIPPDKHVTNENDDEKPLSAGKSSEVFREVFQKAHLRHKQVLKTKNPGKQIALLENEHSKSFAKWLRKEVERELAISKDSVSKANSEVSVEALDLHISKDVATTRKAFYYEVLQEIWVLDYRFRTPTKNYKDTYDEVNEEFSTVIHKHNDNILPRVNRHDLGNESQNDYYRTDCEGEHKPISSIYNMPPTSLST
nr:hypothetical protein [Tanacetum cinerariifolium]